VIVHDAKCQYTRHEIYNSFVIVDLVIALLDKCLVWQVAVQLQLISTNTLFYYYNVLGIKVYNIYTYSCQTKQTENLAHKGRQIR